MCYHPVYEMQNMHDFASSASAIHTSYLSLVLPRMCGCEGTDRQGLWVQQQSRPDELHLSLLACRQQLQAEHNVALCTSKAPLSTASYISATYEYIMLQLPIRRSALYAPDSLPYAGRAVCVLIAVPGGMLEVLRLLACVQFRRAALSRPGAGERRYQA